MCSFSQDETLGLVFPPCKNEEPRLSFGTVAARPAKAGNERTGNATDWTSADTLTVLAVPSNPPLLPQLLQPQRHLQLHRALLQRSPDPLLDHPQAVGDGAAVDGQRGGGGGEVVPGGEVGAQGLSQIRAAVGPTGQWSQVEAAQGAGQDLVLDHRGEQGDLRVADVLLGAALGDRQRGGGLAVGEAP